MKLYIAGAFKDAEKIAQHNKRFEELGHEVISKWTSREPGAIHNIEMKAQLAACDRDEVVEADALIIDFTDTQYAYRGSFTELGIAAGCIACGQNKKIIAICPVEWNEANEASHYCATNVFFSLPEVTLVSTIDEAISALNE